MSLKQFSLILLLVLTLGSFSKLPNNDKYLFIKREIVQTEKGVSSKDTSFTVIISEDKKFVTIKDFKHSDTYMITKRTVYSSVEDYTVYERYESKKNFSLTLSKSPDNSEIIMIEITINKESCYYD